LEKIQNEQDKDHIESAAYVTIQKNIAIPMVREILPLTSL
jgi:hypothetical protein